VAVGIGEAVGGEALHPSGGQVQAKAPEDSRGPPGRLRPLQGMTGATLRRGQGGQGPSPGEGRRRLRDRRVRPCENVPGVHGGDASGGSGAVRRPGC